jgi:hypothetical protein
MMRAHVLIGSMLGCCALAGAWPDEAAAQPAPASPPTAAAAPAAQPPANPTPATQPSAGAPKAAAAPAAATASSETKPAPDAPAAQPGTAPAAATNAEPKPAPESLPGSEVASEQRAAGHAAIERERARIAADLAWRRKQADEEGGGAAEPAPPPSRHHGDAGAPFAIGLSYEAPWYKDPGYNLFDNNDVGQRFGAWAAVDVASLRQDTFVAIEAGWATEHEQDSGLLGGVLGAELLTHAGYAGAQLRWAPVSWLQPHARLAGGLEFVNFTIDAGQRFHDHAYYSPFGSLGAGFTLRTPSRTFEDSTGKLAALSVGLMFEGGYTLARSLDFELAGPTHGAQGIPIADAQAGHLDRSGPYFRMSLVVRF